MNAKLLATVILGVLPLASACKDNDKDPAETGQPELIDEDGDGFSRDEDCDDTNPYVNPSAEELCDGLDNDCDDAIDEDTGADTTWYTDADADGFGDDASAVLACEAPEGTVAVGGDCDDADPAYNPAAVEDDCTDPNDYNCDGSTGYADADGDGYPACQDCDDSSSAINAGADEVCDDLDNDCDGTTDGPGASDAATWYADADGDTYGDDATVLTDCDAPDGYVAYGGDCDDTDAAYNPGASESDCADPNDYNCDGSTGYSDADGDGYAACEDCDDAVAATNPGGIEVCDETDNDCDGTVDESDAIDAGAWYADSDTDGYGDPASETYACDAPEGSVSDNTDCDDTSAASNPAEVEVCDDLDNDCDGTVDESDASDAGTWYADADGDGYGDPDLSEIACEPSDDHVADATDCDDADPDNNPAGDEVCDGADNDCDGSIDEDDASDAGIWYADADGDGYGDETITATGCEAPAGYVAYAGDCDDGDAAYNPGAVEDDCTDPNDYNCDGATGYADGDGDGFAACEDCDDADAEVNPDGAELCDAVDNDCDGAVDEADAGDAGTWYNDGDGDGYGDATDAEIACEAPSGYVADDNDCDDTDASVSPEDAEYCDGADNDCDGTIDEDEAFDTSTWYADTDGDGYGDLDVTANACDAPEGYVADATDCDDSSGSVSPGADETCDEVDNDCDGTTDEDDAIDASTWYYDGDADYYGDEDVTTVACDRPRNYRSRARDCDDTNSAVNPAASEICDGLDNDCDGSIDDGATDTTAWYADDDEDGFGDASVSETACDAPTGYVADDTDCDDGDEDINPDAAEVCNGEDDDCDGAIDDGATDDTTWYADDDSDGFGDAGSSTESCDAPAGYVADDTDCDDTESDIYPGATETCDGEDDDCDGATDESGAVGESTWYEDSDGDGFGDASTAETACDAPAGTVSDDEDCDDTDAAVNPDATETCNEIDDDCNGVTDDPGATGESTWYADADGDGYGDADTSTVDCEAPAGYLADDQDCDDTDADVSPSADELCNGIDDDCDGRADEGDAIDEPTWYADTDGDGYGDDSATDLSCDAPTGYVADGGDCDDADDTIFPTAYDLCNGVDEDCDGTVDEGDIDNQFLLSVDTDIGYAYSVDTDTAHVEIVSTVGTSTKVNSVAVSSDGTAYIERAGTLYVLDVCEGTFTAVGATGTGQTCGLVFDGDGVLWGLDGKNDTLVTIDPTTGAGTTVGSLGFRMGTCGLAYDCTNDRLIGAEGTSDLIFEIDRLTGTASAFYTTGADFDSTGIEYDPRTELMFGATGTDLYEIDSSTGDTTTVGTFDGGMNIDDLTWYPVCE